MEGDREAAARPLLHFLVIGTALFGAYRLAANDRPVQGEIVVSTGQIASLGGDPSSADLATVADRTGAGEALVADDIRDEVLYREAIAMGLDRDDASHQAPHAAEDGIRRRPDRRSGTDRLRS